MIIYIDTKEVFQNFIKQPLNKLKYLFDRYIIEYKPKYKVGDAWVYSPKSNSDNTITFLNTSPIIVKIDKIYRCPQTHFWTLHSNDYPVDISEDLHTWYLKEFNV